MELITPELVATRRISAVDAGVTVAEDIDFGARAPVGAVINAAECAVVPLASLITNTRINVSLAKGTGGTEASIEALFGDDINSDLLCFAAIHTSLVTSGGWAIQQLYQWSWRELEPKGRPISFDGLTAAIGEFVNGTDIDCLWTVRYQLARFADNEIAAFIASRP